MSCARPVQKHQLLGLVCNMAGHLDSDHTMRRVMQPLFISNADSLDALIEAHEAYLDEMQRRLLLAPPRIPWCVNMAQTSTATVVDAQASTCCTHSRCCSINKFALPRFALLHYL